MPTISLDEASLLESFEIQFVAVSKKEQLLFLSSSLLSDDDSILVDQYSVPIPLNMFNALVSSSVEETLKFIKRMSEAPFVPRERLLKHQQHFQNIHKHTYLKGRYDKITSVGIPLALAATSLALIARGIYNMSHGVGKKA